jgi:hypothetical protein
MIMRPSQMLIESRKCSPDWPSEIRQEQLANDCAFGNACQISSRRNARAAKLQVHTGKGSQSKLRVKRRPFRAS